MYPLFVYSSGDADSYIIDDNLIPHSGGANDLKRRSVCVVSNQRKRPATAIRDDDLASIHLHASCVLESKKRKARAAIHNDVQPAISAFAICTSILILLAYTVSAAPDP